MTINGVELEYDFFDLEKMKQHDQALAELQKANEKIMESEGDPYQKMTAQMECIERFFDILFGHGSGTAICGGQQRKGAPDGIPGTGRGKEQADGRVQANGQGHCRGRGPARKEAGTGCCRTVDSRAWTESKL